MFAISNLLAAAGMTLHNTLYNVSRESTKTLLKTWEEADRGEVIERKRLIFVTMHDFKSTPPSCLSPALNIRNGH